MYYVRKLCFSAFIWCIARWIPTSITPKICVQRQHIRVQAYILKVYLSLSLKHRFLVNKMTHQTTSILTNESAIVWCITHTSQCKRHKMRSNAELLAWGHSISWNTGFSSNFHRLVKHRIHKDLLRLWHIILSKQTSNIALCDHLGM